MKKASNKNSQFAVILGEQEVTNSTLVIKNLKTGEQKNIPNSLKALSEILKT